jgi:hypothetical protein
METAYHPIRNMVYEGGLDMKYGVNNNLTIDVTVNTDFAQVEADKQQANLTRFSLFFPEQRLFFQERSSNFDFNFGGPNRLFYSRRIGLYEGEQVRIYGGARLVGRVGSWDLGVLSMQTARVEDVPSENFSVLRMRRQVFNPYSYLGGILTSRIGVDGRYNVALGLDGIFRIFNEDYLTLKLAQTFENGQTYYPASFDSNRIYINWERRAHNGFTYNLVGSYTGSTYNPGVGFELRDNFTCSYNVLGFGWFSEESSPLFYQRLFSESSLILSNADGEPESTSFGIGYEFETKSGFRGRILPRCFYEYIVDIFSLSEDAEIPAGVYKFFNIKGDFSTPSGRPQSFRVILTFGTFFDGWRRSIDLYPKWSISSSLEIMGSYQFNRVTFPHREQQFNSHIARFRILYMLNIKLSASALIQYNSTLNSVIANFRIRYNPREGIDLYLVYNESLNTNRFGSTPLLPFTDSRTVLLKYTYTFNLG